MHGIEYKKQTGNKTGTDSESVETKLSELKNINY